MVLPSLGNAPGRTARAIEIARIKRRPQVREQFDEDELDALAESVKAHGLLHPLTVCPENGTENYLLIAGERRLLAAMRAGFTLVDCVVFASEPPPDKIAALQLVENVHRTDLAPLELAKAYHRLMEAEGYTETELAHELKISIAKVSRTLALLKLSSSVQEMIGDARLAPAHARVLGKLNSEEQGQLAHRIVAEGLTANEAASAVARMKKPKRPAKKKNLRTYRFTDFVVVVSPQKLNLALASGKKTFSDQSLISVLQDLIEKLTQEAAERSAPLV